MSSSVSEVSSRSPALPLSLAWPFLMNPHGLSGRPTPSLLCWRGSGAPAPHCATGHLEMQEDFRFVFLKNAHSLQYLICRESLRLGGKVEKVKPRFVVKYNTGGVSRRSIQSVPCLVKRSRKGTSPLHKPLLAGQGLVADGLLEYSTRST